MHLLGKLPDIFEEIDTFDSDIQKYPQHTHTPTHTHKETDICALDIRAHTNMQTGWKHKEV